MSDGLQPISSAPKDGTIIWLRAVWGQEPDNGRVSFEGLAQWRTERRERLIDPLGRGDIHAHDSTGWMRVGSVYRVPGRAVSWAEQNGTETGTAAHTVNPTVNSENALDDESEKT